LAELSERGRIVPELDDPAVRELLLSRYRVVYEVFPNRVAIVRIIHASRDFLAAWVRLTPR
jgi:plasmid stabilization system protein ParE